MTHGLPWYRLSSLGRFVRARKTPSKRHGLPSFPPQYMSIRRGLSVLAVRAAAGVAMEASADRFLAPAPSDVR